MQSNTGLFVISLDFELMWGIRDKKTISSYGTNIAGVRKVIPALLELFEQYNIHSTFATVGMLFCESKEELLQRQPDLLPEYSVKKYSPYHGEYLETIGTSEAEDIYHYGSSLIKLIQNCPSQEIGTHTYCHYYCLEGASLASFEEDLKMAISVAAKNGVDICSIVFPRNQYSQAHIDICRKLGITSYRGNEKASIYQPRQNNEQSKRIRALRLLDTYINITGHNTHFISPTNEGTVNIPSSRFLRPFSKKLQILDGLRLKRIKNSMTYAAKHKQAYHLWWHPHNFGQNLRENIAFLEKILQHYQYLNKKHGMKSRSMKEIAEMVVK